MTGDVVSVYIELYVASEDRTYTANTSITYPNKTCSASFKTSLSAGGASSGVNRPSYVDGFYSQKDFSGGGFFTKVTIIVTVYVKWGEVAESINVLETFGTSSS